MSKGGERVSKLRRADQAYSIYKLTVELKDKTKEEQALILAEVIRALELDMQEILEDA
jgi:hypothetical protein